jgi:hypothetical protein
MPNDLSSKVTFNVNEPTQRALSLTSSTGLSRQPEVGAILLYIRQIPVTFHCISCGKGFFSSQDTVARLYGHRSAAFASSFKKYRPLPSHHLIGASLHSSSSSRHDRIE